MCSTGVAFDDSQVRLPGNTEVLMSDTVGFIQKLPTQLVASFRATLEEIQEASLILHVVDVSAENAAAQYNAVLQVLEEIGVDSDTPVLTAWCAQLCTHPVPQCVVWTPEGSGHRSHPLCARPPQVWAPHPPPRGLPLPLQQRATPCRNKLDACADPSLVLAAASGRADTVALSGASGEGVDALLALIQAKLAEAMVELEVRCQQHRPRGTDVQGARPVTVCLGHDAALLPPCNQRASGVPSAWDPDGRAVPTGVAVPSCYPPAALVAPPACASPCPHLHTTRTLPPCRCCCPMLPETCWMSCIALAM